MKTKKVLMCPPTYYGIEYEINPWMKKENQADTQKAYQQWQNLYKTYRSLGVEVEVIDHVKGLPDMVFTANGGIAQGKMFISGNFRYKERKGEEQHFQKWFRKNGFTVKKLTHYQGGEGDALFYRGTLYMGYGFRSELESHYEITKLLGVPIVSVKLINPYFYDFDTTFCPLGDKGVLYYPYAYPEEDRKRIASLPNAIPMTKEQAEHFIGNSVYIDGKLLVSYLDSDIRQKLSSLEITPILLDTSEFKKAGGGIKCLTFYLQ